MAEINTTTSRFYENKYPEVDDLVVVNVKEIADMGAYVKLLEYDEIEGMILLSELSRRRIRSIQKLIKVGRNEVVVVLRVDKDKGYIDLSKRRVSPEEAAKCEEKYNKSKAVHSILRHVAEKHKISLETLYETLGWPLSRKYGHAYDGFKLAITNPETVFEGIEPPSKEIFDDLMGQISRKLTPNPVKIRADIEVTCFGYEGIDAVKEALRAGESLHTEQVPVKVKLVAAPLFVLTSTSLDKQRAIETLNQAIDKIRESVVAAGGSLNVKMEPKAVTENDDAELAKLMEKSEAETRQVSGDEYESEEGEDFA
ncbi:translation initiation factor eIF2 subunit alpha [Sugiyamaella lignohabitans]|uniref:Eukaryotic translation initiation factor 2 subunit alpha n=1 Tax=Sugiyamaella lignohabitans TaxID=796027 RepID=A0A161HHF6_9ASCO|nr:translation initiation factor eIF2 subunit alpha [Sugiyamaella lignohabitans]ANB15450.1 translation initiation factor eIF2 subunit alpha [Sugiyamaella lignohabitans]